MGSIDLHLHIVGDSVSSRFRRSLAFRAMRQLQGLPAGRVEDWSPLYQDQLVQHAQAAAGFDRLVLLALDRPYSEVGLPLPAELHTSNDTVASLCRRSPKLHLGASVHPYRPDALERLEEVAAQGAVLIKWLPNSQGIDPADERCRSFYVRLRELQLPLLSHGGDEHVLPHPRQSLGHPARLIPALEAGVTVLLAHAGTRGSIGPDPYRSVVVDLCNRYTRLFLECSALWTPGRLSSMRELLREPFLQDRWLYGSDYPVPIFWPVIWGRGDRELRRAAWRERNPLEARALLALALGLPQRAFTRASEICRW